MPVAAAIFRGRPAAKGRRRVGAGGHQNHGGITIVGDTKVDRAGHPAIHVAAAGNCHRRPRPGTEQLAATASTSATFDSRWKTTNSPVAMSIAVTRNTRSGQSCDGKRWAIT